MSVNCSLVYGRLLLPPAHVDIATTLCSIVCSFWPVVHAAVVVVVVLFYDCLQCEHKITLLSSARPAASVPASASAAAAAA